MTASEAIKWLQAVDKMYIQGTIYEFTTNEIIDFINQLEAEVERLQSMNQAKLDMIHDLRTDLETAKSEAVKEFAERLKKEFHEYRKQYKEVANFDGAAAMLIAKRGVEIVLKEMVGECD